MKRFSVVLVALLAGCGGDPSGGGGGGAGGEGGGGNAGGGPTVEIAVHSVTTALTIGNYPAPSGRYFVVIDQTLTNVAAQAAVPVGQTAFTLQTVAGLVLTASPASATFSPACAADTSLTRGASYRCALAFEEPAKDNPAQLLYDDLRGDSASAPVH